MASLKNVTARFESLFIVIENGSGTVRGQLDETQTASQPASIFVTPRHVLRVSLPSAVRAGMVLRAPAGDVFIVGDNGPSETRRGTMWQSFRLFEATGQYTWQRRIKVTDPITKQLKDTGTPQDLGLVWAAIEPLNVQKNESAINTQFEQSRIIAGAPLQNGDYIDNHTVSKLDKELGLSIGLLT